MNEEEKRVSLSLTGIRARMFHLLQKLEGIKNNSAFTEHVLRSSLENKGVDVAAFLRSDLSAKCFAAKFVKKGG